jgi:hypothetical protein
MFERRENEKENLLKDGKMKKEQGWEHGQWKIIIWEIVENIEKNTKENKKVENVKRRVTYWVGVKVCIKLGMNFLWSSTIIFGTMFFRTLARCIYRL